MTSKPSLLVFDSGLGGLTVHKALRDTLPQAETVYIADDAAFPYGDLADHALIERVCAVMGHLIPAFHPDLVVIACNTASTLVLPDLRSRFGMPFVGTVPAIKPAAEASLSRRIAILATPATVKRDYTQGLIREFAGDCDVILHAPAQLAMRAEKVFEGGLVSDHDLRADIAPCFVEADGRRTDTVVLGCTHYPLLLERFRAVAPWSVNWIDPAPAIARRAEAMLASRQFMGERDAMQHSHLFINTGADDLYGRMRGPLANYGFMTGEWRPIG
jgi:glutamate racemase